MAEETPEHVLEEGRRLSECAIWRLQKNFYDRSGVTAWNTGTVPHYITNNPNISRAYFRVFLGYLRDLVRGSRDGFDPQQPIYVIEPGAGAGRFAYLFLKALYEHEGAEPLDQLKVCYVMADFTRSNVDFWAQHPQLKPFAEAGHLDFAVFDVERDRTMKLERSGAVLSAETLRNPVVVIGNYLFDTLTQDVFRVKGGRLHECLATLSTAEPADLANPPDDLLGRLKITYEQREVGPGYYEDPEWNHVLEAYRDCLGDTGFCLPVGALRCAGGLLEMSQNRLMMIMADKSWNRIEEMSGLDDPMPVMHGQSFSMTVNFHAVGMLFEGRGGIALHSEVREAMLDVSVFLVDARTPTLNETRLAFREHIDAFGPIDFFHLKERLQEELPKPSLRLALDLLRLSGWDPDVFYAISDSIATHAESASTTVRRELMAALERTWASYYHIGASKDVPFEIARIYYRLEHYTDSLRYYDLSLELFGEHKMTLHNMGLAHYYMRDLDKAVSHFQKALEMDPNYDSARDWLIRISAERNSREALRKGVGARG